jgi:hypothetical protein
MLRVRACRPKPSTQHTRELDVRTAQTLKPRTIFSKSVGNAASTRQTTQLPESFRSFVQRRSQHTQTRVNQFFNDIQMQDRSCSVVPSEVLILTQL